MEHVLCCPVLAINRYFDNPAFLNYLQYLKYWKQPQYAKYIVYVRAPPHIATAVVILASPVCSPVLVHLNRYPHCLAFLDMLDDERFRQVRSFI